MTKTIISLNANPPKPHVKWGHLIFSVACILIEIALWALNFYANAGHMVGCNLGIGLIAAYGGFVGIFILLLPAGATFFEEFLPSFQRFQEWKEVQNFKKETKRLLRESIRSNRKKEFEALDELISSMK